MKILIVSQHFYPEPFRINDIAQELSNMGHEVSVLTGIPNYPLGHIYLGYEQFRKIDFYKNICIYRCKEVPRKKGLINRLINYYSYALKGKKLARKLPNDFDVIIRNETSPIIACFPAIEYKRKNHKPLIMLEMDLWPESLLAGGIRKNGFIYNYFKKVSSKIYRQCDYILVSTKEHENYIRELKGCKDLNIDYLPQYAENIFSKIKSKKYNGELILTFAGNIGKAQCLMPLLEAMLFLKKYQNIKLKIIGDGSELIHLKNFKTNNTLDNVEFISYRPLEDMPIFYENSDVMVVSLENSNYANLTIPGKVQTYMFAKKPILCLASGSTYNLIEESKSGICVDSKDPSLISEAIIRMQDEKILRYYANNSFEYYLEHFSKKMFFNKLLNILEKKVN